MKSVVVDINDQYAVVLTDAGDFKRITNTGNLKVGDEFVEKVKSFVPRLIRSAASIAAIFLLGFIASFYYLNFTPHGYIDVRINPGIKITLNAMNKVIAVDGLNQDGVDLLANIKQKESDPRKVLDSIVSKAAEMGFFKAGNPVRITVAIKDPEKVTTMENTLMETAQNALKNNSVSVPVSAFSIDVQDYRALETDRKNESADATNKPKTTDTAETADTENAIDTSGADGVTDTSDAAIATDETDTGDAEDTTDYSPAWKEKTVKPCICDVKFSKGNIIIEFNHNLTLDNVKVYAYPENDPTQKLEAKIVALKNDKLTVTFDSLTPGETYKLEAAGVATKDGALLDPIAAKIIQPAIFAENNDDDQDQSYSAQSRNNGNGYINDSANGNYRNEAGNGNGNAYGLDKQKTSGTDVNGSATANPGNQAQQNGKGNAGGLNNKNEEQDQEKLQEQEQEQEQNDPGNQGGNSEQNRNENTDNGRRGNEKQNGNVSGADTDVSPGISAIRPKIVSVEPVESALKITFNTDLALAGAKVTAISSNGRHTQAVTGQAEVVDDRTLLVAFPSLEQNRTYTIVVENIALKDGTKLNDLKAGYHMRRAEKTGNGSRNANSDEKTGQEDGSTDEQN